MNNVSDSKKFVDIVNKALKTLHIVNSIQYGKNISASVNNEFLMIESINFIYEKRKEVTNIDG